MISTIKRVLGRVSWEEVKCFSIFLGSVGMTVWMVPSEHLWLLPVLAWAFAAIIWLANLHDAVFRRRSRERRHD